VQKNRTESTSFAVNDKSFNHACEYPSYGDIGGVPDTSASFSPPTCLYASNKIHPVESCNNSLPLMSITAAGDGGGEGGKFAGGGDGSFGGGGGGGDGLGGGFGGGLGGGLGGGFGGGGGEGGGGEGG